MKVKRTKKIKQVNTVWLCLLCICAGLFMAGCIDEDRDGCHTTYTLMVKAYDVNQQELPAAEVSDVSLFVFDGNGAFVERIDTRTHEDITIQATPGEGMHLVAWGNVGDECHAYSAMLPGDPKDRGFLYLLPDPLRELHSLSPDDLFLGEKDIPTPEQAGGRIVLPVYRQVGSLAITVRRLKAFTGFDDDDYSVVVKGTRSVLDFSGQLSGDPVAYRPEGSFIIHEDDRDEFHVPPFHLFPEEDALSIEIYYGSQLVASVSENADGTPVTIQTEMLTNVLIDLRTTVNVSISLTPWGEEQIWKEF